MIHAKLLVKRLAYGPWLLAFALVLGWAGEAMADIRLSVDRNIVREDAGETKITVTATNYDVSGPAGVITDVSKDTRVFLDRSVTGLGSRFSMSLSSLLIQEGENTATGTFTFEPINDTLMGNDNIDDGVSDDLWITISGTASATTVVPTRIILLDDDKASEAIILSYSPKTLSQNQGETEIEVTATLSGATLSEDLSFSLRVGAASTTTRDTDYRLRFPSEITIRKNKTSATETLIITPLDKGAGDIVLEASPISLSSGGTIRVAHVGGGISITSASTTIEALTATPALVREDAGRTEITLTVTLTEAAPIDETVQFALVAPSTGTTAVRDQDYQVRLSGTSIVIPAGKTEGTTTLTLTPLNNEQEDGDKSLGMQATASGGSQQVDITIADDETASTSIALTVSLDEIQEDTGTTEVTVTGTLDGATLDDDVTLVITQQNASTATRDLDYSIKSGSLEILAGQIQGSATITITPTDDGTKEQDETIILGLLSGSTLPSNQDGDPIAVGTATITLKDTGKRVEPEPGDDTTPVFTGATADLSATVGTAITPVVLPAATGDGTLTYSVAGLPAGLTFNAATRTISGTPTVAETNTIIYTVFDGDTGADLPAESAVRVFTITVAPKPPRTVAVKSLTASHLEIREDAGRTEITLTVTLAEAAPADETVRFAFVGPAVRDIDYDASLRGTITIPAGKTEGTTTLTLTPKNNSAADGNRSLGVQATASGGSRQVNITIADDEIASTSIVLAVSPRTISEKGGRTTVTVTATLNGQPLSKDATVTLSIDPNASTAKRDTDYAIVFEDNKSQLTIPAGQLQGSTTVSITPIDDGAEEQDETITLTGAIDGLEGDEVEIMLSDQAAVSGGSSGSSLAFAATVADQEFTVGTAIDPLVLPQAVNGTPPLTYRVLDLPTGLTFNSATRAISGTPAEKTDGAIKVTYVAIDAANVSAVLSFSITVNSPSGSSEDSGSSLAFTATVADQAYTVGTAIDSLVLPQATGGTGTLRYRLLPSLSEALPGLMFDPSTRTISGIPLDPTEDAVQFTYLVTDDDGKTATLSFSIKVNPELSFGGLFGSSKIVPTASHDLAAIREFIVGQRVEGVVLPEAAGGTAPLTYRLSPALPAGLTFDVATRTIAGTPRAAGETVYTYAVTDANGASMSLSLQTLPTTFALADNFPNPFNPVTMIQYGLPHAADVELTVYNVVGQPVRMLVAEHQSAGRYMVEWDATDDSGHRLSSGMYFYRLQAGGEFHEIKKMLLLK